MALNISYKAEGTDEQMLAKQLGLTSAVTLIPRPKVSKQEEDFIVNSMAAEDLDEFSADLFDPSQTRNALLRPTHNFARLEQLCQQNNALGQNISAYEVNIDGTGYVVERDTDDADEVPEDDEQADAVQDFFDAPSPATSWRLAGSTRRRCAWSSSTTPFP